MSMRKLLVKSETSRNAKYTQLFYFLLFLVANLQPELLIPICFALKINERCNNNKAEFKLCASENVGLGSSALEHTYFAKKSSGYFNLTQGSLLVHKIPLLKHNKQDSKVCASIPPELFSNIICKTKTILSEKHILYIGEVHTDVFSFTKNTGRALLNELMKKMPENTIVFGEKKEEGLGFKFIPLDKQSSYLIAYNRIAFLLHIIYLEISEKDDTLQAHLSMLLFYSKSDIWSQLNTLELPPDQNKILTMIKEARRNTKSFDEMINYVEQNFLPLIKQNPSMRISFFNMFKNLLNVVEPKIELSTIPDNLAKQLNLIKQLKSAHERFTTAIRTAINQNQALGMEEIELFTRETTHFVGESRNISWGDIIYNWIIHSIKEIGIAPNIIVLCGNGHIKGLEQLLAPVVDLIAQNQEVMAHQNEL